MTASKGRVLIISNGHGEDQMGALLGRALQSRGYEVFSFPLVGEGLAYRSAGLTITGVQKTMPSGGFILDSGRALWRDIKAGLLRLTWQQAQALRRSRHQVDWAIGVGDIYPLLMNALFLRRPFILIPTAKSDYIRSHFAWECALMRRCARLVLPRDLRTAVGLAKRDVTVEYLGNLMMDAMTFTGEHWGLAGKQVVGLLPGSREPEAYNNTRLILECVARINEEAAGAAQEEGPAAEEEGSAVEPHFVLALAGSLSPERLAAVVQADGWQWQPSEGEEAARGVKGRLCCQNGAEVLVVSGRFGDVLALSTVVIGMSGTGNEQAAGLGIPVVAPTGAGPQFTAAFAEDQHRLLGEALLIVREGPAAVAAAVKTLLRDVERRRRMGDCGRERMGPPGAAERMAKRLDTLMQNRGPKEKAEKKWRIE
ncbi:MAG TPA: hypothetical protein GXX29_06755 [Firmicutes bacterium]|nr:hypothetical protein [Bacillota bacterium]